MWGDPDVSQTQTDGLEVIETREWLDSLDYVLAKGGPERAGRLIQQLSLHARLSAGVNLPFTATTPYQNTISVRQQPPFPGSQDMERRIKSLVRWNALAWWSAPIKRRRALVDTFRHSLPRPRSMKWLSIISFVRKPKLAIAMSFIFRVMPRPESMPGPIWKGGLALKNCTTSAAN